MLKLSGTLAVSSDSGPVVRPGDVLVYACVDHGFNGEDMANFHETCGFVSSVVGDVRRAMEQISDSVAAVGTVYRKTMLVLKSTRFLR